MRAKRPVFLASAAAWAWLVLAGGAACKDPAAPSVEPPAAPVQPAAPEAPEVVPLQKGERIVFLGDSITQGGARPGGFIRLIEAALAERRADLGVTCLGAGISGNKVPDLQARLQKDVLDKKPTLVIIYIGINDVWHWHMPKLKGTEKGPYEEGLKDILGRLRAAGARVVLCTPSVIGEKPDGANPHDAMLDEYADISRKVAREGGAQLLDLRGAFLAHLKTHNPGNQPKGILTRDGVHLSEAGNRFVADRMLEVLGLEPAPPPAGPRAIGPPPNQPPVNDQPQVNR